MSADLINLLARGPATATQLRVPLAWSQPTFSRTVAGLRGEVAVLGRGRSTRYALYRRIRDLAPEIPVHRITPAGAVRRIGTLLTVAPDRYWFDDADEPGASAEFPSLPWFLTDLRPQGFLGRIFPRIFPEIGLPDRVDQWTEDQALYAIARRGEDTSGNLIVGDESLARFVAATEPSVMTSSDRLHRYPALAADALSGRVAGSSAAGEQPKFTAAVGDSAGRIRHVLVKFCSAIDSAVGRRWADLLVGEEVAGRVLTRHGHRSARSEFFTTDDRAYLEVERFDRSGMRGRMGLVSLGALDDQFVGQRQDWAASASELRRAGLIEEADARALQWLSAFGSLIANTDMHFGNVSFLVTGRRQFRLAPTYDMLPMAFAPIRESVPDVRYLPPVPRPGQADQWLGALSAAREYWDELAADNRCSTGFRALAADAARALAGSH